MEQSDKNTAENMRKSRIRRSVNLADIRDGALERGTVTLETWVPDHENAVRLEADFEVSRSGPARCTRLTLVADDGAAVTSDVTRALPIRRIARHMAAYARSAVAADPAQAMRLDYEHRARRRRGARDQELQEIAEIYISATKFPVKAVKKAFPFYGDRTITRRIAEARERGLL